jgi:hypothetical protein
MALEPVKPSKTSPNTPPNLRLLGKFIDGAGNRPFTGIH